MYRIILLGVIILLSGCAYTTSNYYYVSLERADGISVAARAKLQLKNLENNTEIPVKYVAIRNGYELTFLIGDKSYYPHMHISVSAVEGGDLMFKPRRDTRVVSEEGNICASYHLQGDASSEMDFGWAVNCLSDGIKKQISFDIVSSSGKYLSSEDIQFEIKSNGKYTFLDAL